MAGSSSNPAGTTERVLPRRQRWLVLAVAFLAWMFAGLEISMFPLIARTAMVDFIKSSESKSPEASPSAPSPTAASVARALTPQQERQAKQWFSWYITAFLTGAAAGGWIFGAMGDRRGRTKAMALSILCYSLVTGLSYFASSPTELLVLRFIACLGIGGVWPNAVSLVAEVWPDVSRPALAGLLGAAANFGFVLLGLIGYYIHITPDSWRWVLLVGASPAVLGFFCWFAVPESPRWLAGGKTASTARPANPLGEIFQRPLLQRTLIGICLGTVPVVGTAVSAVWVTPWADKVAAESGTSIDPGHKAWTQITRSSGGAVGSLLGGWLASLLGRRTAYFFISLASLGVSVFIYGFLDPYHPQFSLMVFALGLVGVTYFGWLPLYLPELFPTRVRSTGMGVTFNSGRMLAAIGALGTGSLLQVYDMPYASVGLWTSAIYAVGMIAICFAPDTGGKKLED